MRVARSKEAEPPMPKLINALAVLSLGLTSPAMAQNAPWPPPAGMSMGEYLQRYGGNDLRRQTPDLYRSLPEPPRQNAPPTPTTGSNPLAGVKPGYNFNTGKYELPCPPAAKRDPY